VKEGIRIFEIARGKAQQELKDRNLADDDSVSIGVVKTPDDLKHRAVNDVVEDHMILGTRKREQNRTFGAESPMAKRLKRNTRGSKNSDAMHWRVVKERGENDSSKLGEAFGPISCPRHSSIGQCFRSIGGANSK
jgi:hypothetical protein